MPGVLTASASASRAAAAARITNSTASKGNAVKGFLTFSKEGTSYIETSKGNYDVIAGSPAVKNALRRLGASTGDSFTGQRVVSLRGELYPREGGLTGYRITDLTVVGKPSVAKGVVKENGKFFATLGTKKVPLKPMTKDATAMLERAARGPSGTATGMMNGKTFEVWVATQPIRFDR